MATLLLCLALQETRVSLELRDVPLREVAERALKPFGHATEWIREPLASQPASLSLKDAGYFQALDAVCGLAGLPKVNHAFHPAAFRGLLCGNYFDGRRTIAVLDLSESIRLIAVLIQVDERQPALELTLMFPPGQGAHPACELESLRINGRPSSSDAPFKGWGRQDGCPTSLHFAIDAPSRKIGESIDLAGVVVLEGRRIPFQTDRFIIPPEPMEDAHETPGPPAGYLVQLSIAGLSACGLLAFLWLRLASRRS